MSDLLQHLHLGLNTLIVKLHHPLMIVNTLCSPNESSTNKPTFHLCSSTLIYYVFKFVTKCSVLILIFRQRWVHSDTAQYPRGAWHCPKRRGQFLVFILTFWNILKILLLVVVRTPSCWWHMIWEKSLSKTSSKHNPTAILFKSPLRLNQYIRIPWARKARQHVDNFIILSHK
jgi:hypothetical protein